MNPGTSQVTTIKCNTFKISIPMYLEGGGRWWGLSIKLTNDIFDRGSILGQVRLSTSRPPLQEKLSYKIRLRGAGWFSVFALKHHFEMRLLPSLFLNQLTICFQPKHCFR